MGHGNLIRRPDSTPAPDPRGYAYGLPPEMLRQTSFRLGMAALVYAATYLLAYGSGRLFARDPGHVHETVGPFHSSDIFAAGSMVFRLVTKKSPSETRMNTAAKMSLE